MDWQTGDLALCIHSQNGMQGRLFHVSQVGHGNYRGRVEVGLRFFDFPSPPDNGGYLARQFVCVTPFAPIEGAEIEPRICRSA